MLAKTIFRKIILQRFYIQITDTGSRISVNAFKWNNDFRLVVGDTRFKHILCFQEYCISYKNVLY